MDYSKHVGDVYSTKDCGDLIITKYCGSRGVYVKFLSTGYETKTALSSIKNGCVRDRMTPSVLGVGTLGNESICKDGQKLREYTLWFSMLLRCYDDKTHLHFPSYSSCEVSENFKYFQYFKEWCNNQVGFKENGWQLDKDILVKGNKLYSEDTCCFVPPEINSLIIKTDRNRGSYPVGVSYDKSLRKFSASLRVGSKSTRLGMFNTDLEAFLAYKQAKEAHIKEVANKWMGAISVNVYNALLNYSVSYDD